MGDDPFPVEWTGRQAVVAFPGHVDVSNVGQLRDRLLSVINRGPAVLIADMTDTASCDHSAVEALARACQRAAISGTQVRLVVTAPAVRRVLSIEGLDRLVSIYPSLEAATGRGAGRVRAATRRPDPGGQRSRRGNHHPGRPLAAAGRPGRRPGADRSRGENRSGQPAVRGDVRLQAGRTDRPAGRLARPVRRAGRSPPLPGRLPAGAAGQAYGRTGQAGRAA